ncbi:hypothetical protein DBV15_12360, partial [Temnothorax longispinosus]
TCFQRRLPEDPTRLSHLAAKQSAYRVRMYLHRAHSRGAVEFFVCRESREQDAVSRDCSRLQLLAACPVSRGGTTSDPWAMSAAMEAAGDHVLYRGRPPTTMRGKERESILACVSSQREPQNNVLYIPARGWFRELHKRCVEARGQHILHTLAPPALHLRVGCVHVVRTGGQAGACTGPVSSGGCRRIPPDFLISPRSNRRIVCACTYIAPIHAEPSNFSRLQLLAACPVSRGGTTSDPWAMSAAMEAAGDHVLYRGRPPTTMRGKERESILACVSSQRGGRNV